MGFTKGVWGGKEIEVRIVKMEVREMVDEEPSEQILAFC
jgi:hypothetical protein